MSDTVALVHNLVGDLESKVKEIWFVPTNCESVKDIEDWKQIHHGKCQKELSEFNEKGNVV